ncbi:beta-glucosidase [Lacibacter cauensis]|uniref:Periplasmic beta-glucosidase n=1 Tax=Lacibacter cauensis TaxID=510947 RepID=A0A562SF40_9BACT|nr:glycoside hydrolase family 3 N-terminal domain-containing protein [Lacibacter cauensis]TWI79260.1 beta-glucosidase [Lacibacter cauensis]
MKRVALLLVFSLSTVLLSAQTTNVAKMNRFLDSLLRIMTLEEKIGQMNQYSSDFAATGPITKDGDKQTQIRKGLIGSYLNVTGAERTRSLQEIAMQSRLKIPLLFGQDVIHGYRTIFPLPLAEAASWDMDAIELSARIAAIEASAAGIHWTFAPMVDISRDPRWGRVMEGAGEDPLLGSFIAKARVKGFQGKGFGYTDAVLACVKHFAAYGAAVGGRDYNSVDMSNRMLYETYLPPFKAAADAGAATFMNSFNDLNGIPATGNRFLQRDILKGQWKFTGFVVSDWGSVGEMVNHGYAKDNYEAAMLAANAGSDMDMESRAYIQHLARLVKEGKVKMSVIDDAVRRILRKKYELGLFTDPYKFSNVEREKQQWNNPQHLAAAKEIAAKSIVLLKNEKQLLPISKQTKKIALIGPLVKAVKEHLGFWSYDWDDDSVRVPSLYQAVQNKVSSATQLLYAKGCELTDTSSTGFAEAVNTAANADVVVMYVGEKRDMSGEAKSRSNIHIPGVQEELIKAVVATGKPVVVLIAAGRPLVFNWTAENVPAILYTWWLGTKGADAIADVLFGDYNPSGKLPMTFPRSEGQIPVYYNHYNTGRPAKSETDVNYVSAYTDLLNSPQYPFGFGLSYTQFEYSDIQLNKSSFKAGETLTATVTVINNGNYDGEEVVQLYTRDITGSVVRPVKELKAFQKIKLKKGESKQVQFTLTANDLRFYNGQLQYIYEPGEFHLFIGGNSRDGKKVKFELKK